MLDYLDSDECYIQEWVDSGLANVQKCLAIQEEIKAKLDTNPTLEDYNKWMKARVGFSCCRDLDKLRRVLARRNRTALAALARLTN